MARLLFRVADAFSIPGRGVVVAADITASAADFRLRVGDPIELVRADESRLRTEVRGIEMPMVPAGVDPPFVFLVGMKVDRVDVEIGAEVWRVELEPPVS